jgi:hypothetical protein
MLGREIPKPLSEMTQGHELLLRAVIDVAIRVMELNGVSKEELVSVKYCFSDHKHFARMEHIAQAYPESKAIFVGRRVFDKLLEEPFGLFKLIQTLVHEFLHIVHPYSPEEYTRRERQIEEEIDREADEYFRKGLSQIATSWASLKSQEDKKGISLERKTPIGLKELTKEEAADIVDEFCTCGHLKSEHEKGDEKCNKPNCDCGWYTWGSIWVLKNGERRI